MSASSQTETLPGDILVLKAEEQQHVFDLCETFRVAIGRHSSNDVVLDSRKVSNYHAEILNEGDSLRLRDLGSTNGTYVNDERVKQHRLRPGDQLRIGGYLFMVVLRPREDGEGTGSRAGLFPVGAQGDLSSFIGRSRQEGATPGETSAPTLADLLEIYHRSRRSVLLILRRYSKEGRIYIERGSAIHAELGSVRGEKALYRLLGWPDGSFEVREYPSGTEPPRSIELPTDSVLAEGLQEVEEGEKLLSLLPPLSIPLCLKEDCSVRLSELTPPELQIFQALIRHQTLDRVLEESPLTDFRILSLAYSLIHQKKVFTLEQNPAGLLEGTLIHRSH